MEEIKKYFSRWLNGSGGSLFLAVFLVVIFLVWFSVLGILPLKNLGDFAFLSALVFLLAVYRPGWAFLAFVALLPLENIFLNPAALPLAVRPYQWVGGLLIIALGLRKVTGQLEWLKIKFHWLDSLPILMILGVGLSAGMNHASLKEVAVFSSFVAWYFLVRIFVNNKNDLKRVVPFFLGSGLVVTVLAVGQNLQFLHGRVSQEVMAGRPNATFSEPDWLGIFLILLIGLLVFYLSRAIRKEKLRTNPVFWGSEIFLILATAVLIITVSRSAWLGTALAVSLFVFGGFVWSIANKFSQRKKYQLIFLLSLGGAVFLAGGLVKFVPLTNFQLFNRLQSTSSGEQKITIACAAPIIAERINALTELEGLHCRHINLEEREKERAEGFFVQEVYRPDPNVNIRKTVWAKSWTLIKAHPWWGIGWGNISQTLGQDERGAGLNASNIFLEMWLGGGLLGFLALVVFLAGIGWGMIKNLWPGREEKRYFLALTIFSCLAGWLLANFFNAGLLLGVVWFFFAISLTLENYENRH